MIKLHDYQNSGLDAAEAVYYTVDCSGGADAWLESGELPCYARLMLNNGAKELVRVSAVTFNATRTKAVVCVHKIGIGPRDVDANGAPVQED
jgi:hypothetical protein